MVSVGQIYRLITWQYIIFVAARPTGNLSSHPWIVGRTTGRSLKSVEAILMNAQDYVLGVMVVVFTFRLPRNSTCLAFIRQKTKNKHSSCFVCHLQLAEVPGNFICEYLLFSLCTGVPTGLNVIWFNLALRNRKLTYKIFRNLWTFEVGWRDWMKAWFWHFPRRLTISTKNHEVQTSIQRFQKSESSKWNVRTKRPKCRYTQWRISVYMYISYQN